MKLKQIALNDISLKTKSVNPNGKSLAANFHSNHQSNCISTTIVTISNLVGFSAGPWY